MRYITLKSNQFPSLLSVLGLAVTLAACELPFSTGERGTEFFFTQSTSPNVVMDALFTGRVVRGEEGCLRLASHSGQTVIWPVDYSLDGEAVRDAAGNEVGTVGGDFRLAGGEVPWLHDGIDVTVNTRELAEEKCPGRYWIVADS